MEADYPPLQPQLQQKLADFFAPHTRALLEYLGDDIQTPPPWAPLDEAV
jgi:hypothetical protein